MWGRSVLHPGHDTSCPYKNRCEFFNFTELRLDAIALPLYVSYPLLPANVRYNSHKSAEYYCESSCVERHLP